MFGVRQVGFLVGVGPVFVASIGTESKVAILQCSVEPRGWVTRIMAPEHVNALNAAGGGAFPYTQDQCSIEGYENLEYVTLGTNEYLLPNFSSDLKGYINPYSDWKKTTFTAPNVIRNKAEWDYYGGNPGTPVTTTPAPTTTPTPTTTTGNTGGTSNGGTTTVVTNPTSKAPTVATSNTLIYVGIAVIIFIVVIAMANND